VQWVDTSLARAHTDEHAELRSKLARACEASQLLTTWQSDACFPTASAARPQELLIKAHSAAESAVEVSAIQQRLTLEERRIFDGGRASVAAFDRWRHSDLVPQHRRLLPQKRKLLQDADVRNGTTAR